MKISTRMRYGARAMVELARSGQGKPLAIQWIASRQQISPSYLEQLLAKLRKAGLVKSYKGPVGGYMLARSPEEITLLDVFIALEGKIGLVHCMMPQNPQCERIDYCVMRLFWNRFQQTIEQFLKSITVSELLEKENELFSKTGAKKPRRMKRVKRC